MVAEVAVVNPGFTNALESLARIGRTIDQAIRPAAFSSLRLLGFGVTSALTNPLRNGAAQTAVLPGTGADAADTGSATGGIREVYFSPAPQSSPIVPPLPGLDALQALSRSIANALSATLLPKFDDLTQSITECCAQLTEITAGLMRAVASIDVISKVMEACKCTGATEETKKSLDRIERSIAKSSEFGWKDAIRSILPYANFAGTILGGLAVGLAALELLPIEVPAAAVAALTAGLTAAFGSVALLNVYGTGETLEDIDKSTEQTLENARNPKVPSRGGAVDLPRGQRPIALREDIREFEAALRRLREIIEDPEAETDSRKHLLREDAERVLPEVKSRFEELLQLFKNQSREDPPLDPEIQKWLRELDQQNNGAPPIGPEYDPNAAPVPGPSSSVAPAVTPAAFSEQGSPSESLTLAQLMELVVAKLKEPVRLELRVLDDRVIARRLDGNRGVNVDMSRGPRLIGYMNV